MCRNKILPVKKRRGDHVECGPSLIIKIHHQHFLGRHPTYCTSAPNCCLSRLSCPSSYEQHHGEHQSRRRIAPERAQGNSRHARIPCEIAWLVAVSSLSQGRVTPSWLMVPPHFFHSNTSRCIFSAVVRNANDAVVVCSLILCQVHRFLLL